MTAKVRQMTSNSSGNPVANQFVILMKVLTFKAMTALLLLEIIIVKLY